MNNAEKIINHSIRFVALWIGILFVIMKMVDHVDWHWLIVLFPFYIAAAITFNNMLDNILKKIENKINNHNCRL